MELLENEGCDIPAAGFLEHKSKMTCDRNLDGALLLFALRHEESLMSWAPAHVYFL